jgi:hypothetical protein
MDTWLEIAKTFGLPGVLLAYFIWQDHLRNKRSEAKEDATIKRVRELEDFQKTQLVDMTKQVCTALANSTRAIDTISRILEDRPCVAKDMQLLATAAEAESD